MGFEVPTEAELAFCERVRERLNKTEAELSNIYIIRFTHLSASLPSTDKAFIELCDEVQRDIDWRAKAKPQNLLNEYHSPRLPELYPLTFFGEDKTGHPVVWSCPGKMSPNKLFGEFDSDDIDRWYISVMEYARVRYEPTVGGNGKHMVIVLDLSGLGTSHADMRLINWIRGRSAFDIHHYPNAFAKVFVVNAGWAFTAIWKMVKPLFPASTIELIEILGGSSAYLPKLLERIDKQYIPDFLGGDAKDIFAPAVVFGSSDPNAPLGALSKAEKVSFKAAGRALPAPFKEICDHPAGSAAPAFAPEAISELAAEVAAHADEAAAPADAAPDAPPAAE